MASFRGPRTWSRYIPTLRVPFSGSRVITCGSVRNGPPSWGQVVSTGRSPRSTSAPRRTTSWQAAEETCLGAIEASRPSLGRSLSFSHSETGGAVRSKARSSEAWSSKSSQDSAQLVRRRVPNRFMATGSDPGRPVTASKSRAGPPCLAARSASAAISSTGSTGSRTRTSSLARSSRSRNSWSER